MALAIVDLKNWKVQQLVGNNAAADLRISGNDVGQEGPTYSPDGKQLWLGQTDGYTQVHRERRRHRSPTRRPSRSRRTARSTRWSARRCSRPTAPPCTPRSTARTAWSPSTRRPAPSSRAGPSATPRATWSMVGSKLYVSNEGGRPAKPGDTTINSYGTQVPANPVTGATTTGTVSVIDLANPAAAVGEHRRRSAPDRAVRQERRAVRHQHRHQQRVGHRHRQATRSCRPSPPSRGRRRRSATSPTR